MATIFSHQAIVILAFALTSLGTLTSTRLVNHQSRSNVVHQSSPDFSVSLGSEEEEPQLSRRVVEEDSSENEIFERESGNVGSGGYIPIVYWHGMGDAGAHVKHSLSFIEDQLPGVYVKSVQIGSSIPEDIKSGYFVNVNDQVKQVCEEIKNDTNLQNGYNAIGLSQGGQFLRAVAQRCPEPRMYNLISLGGQHQGVFGLPKCSAPKQEWCEIIDKLLTHVAYESWVQKFLVQAEYWHDPFKQEEYANNSVFIAEINNEKVKNPTYKENLLRLRNFVMVMFDNDTIVEPKESEWFGFYKPGSDKEMIPLEDSPLYLEDWLGLKQLNDDGRLHFLSSAGDHLQFTKEWFTQRIITPFLKHER